jgi:murein DD-endopeptidase MepM/ murein hydrolase activator NlpD
VPVDQAGGPTGCVSFVSGGIEVRPVRILSTFGDTRGPEDNQRRNGPHRSVDIGGAVGTEVIAPAEGSVLLARDEGDACGKARVFQRLSER